MIVWIDGELIDASQPVLKATDRALLGDGVFDTMLAVNGIPVHCQAHISRLIRHAAILGITPAFYRSQLLEGIDAILAANGHTSGYYAVKTVITMGPGGRGLESPPSPAPVCLITSSPAPDPASLGPVSVIVSSTTRRNEFSPLSGLKSLSYADNRLARQEALKKGAEEALLLNTSDRAACAASGNIFLEMNGKIATPPLCEGTIDGIIRQSLLDNRKEIEERPITAADLGSCTSFWITNSIAGIRPVRSLDGRMLEIKPLTCQICGANT